MKTYIGIIIILGIASGIIFFVSGIQLNRTGNNMKELHSQDGNSLAEFYYQDMGEMNKGLGLLSDALGVSIIPLSIGIGIKFFGDYENKNISNSKSEKAEESSDKLGL
jgi:hypothetical protein